MAPNSIDLLRHHSRKLVRELGMLQLDKVDVKEQPSYWHTLIEINKESDLTISKLSHLLLISLPTVSRIVSALIKDGLVILGWQAEPCGTTRNSIRIPMDKLRYNQIRLF